MGISGTVALVTTADESSGLRTGDVVRAVGGRAGPNRRGAFNSQFRCSAPEHLSDVSANFDVKPDRAVGYTAQVGGSALGSEDPAARFAALRKASGGLIKNHKKIEATRP